MNTPKTKIKLSQSEIDYLQNSQFLQPTLLHAIENLIEENGRACAININRETAEEFRSAFTKQLAKVGFNEAYELTAEGRLLEDLIDRFYLA